MTRIPVKAVFHLTKKYSPRPVFLVPAVLMMTAVMMMVMRMWPQRGQRHTSMKSKEL